LRIHIPGARARMEFLYTKSFDLYCWICMFAISRLFALVQRNIRFAFDVGFVLQQQPFQMKWARLHTCLMEIFLVCQYGYVAIITRDVLVPIPRLAIQDVDELIESRRWLVSSQGMVDTIIEANIANTKIGKGRKGLTGQNSFVVDETLLQKLGGAHRLPSPRLLAKLNAFTWNGKSTVNGFTHFIKDGTTCHVVEQSAKYFVQAHVVSSYNSAEYQNLSLILIDAGFLSYWFEYGNRWNVINYAGNFSAIHPTIAPLAIFSQLLVIFRVYAILIGVSALAVGIELLQWKAGILCLNYGNIVQ